MKNKLLKVASLATVMLVCVSMVTTASATADITGDTINGSTTGTYSTTVNVTGVGTSDEVSLLVVKADTDLTKLVASDVLYVGQKTAAKATDADTTGSASFTFTTRTEAFDVYSGYSTMALTDNPLSIEYQSSVGPVMNAEKSKLYDSTSPFGMTGYRRVFIKLTENNGSWIPAHSNADSEIYYSTELTGYDGLVKTTATDLASIFGEITWTSGTPSADATISKYGDANADGAINANDYRHIKSAVLEDIIYNVKQYLVGDVTDDSAVNANDYRQIKYFVLEDILEFSTVTNKK